MGRIYFGADGIRGIVGYWPFDERGPAIIGRALGKYLAQFGPQPQAVLGRDTRASGHWIAAGLTTGLLEAGVLVLDVGIMTTPGVAYLTRHTRADLGISISASHNPPQYNGIKLVNYYGLRFQREDEMAIEALVEELARAEWNPDIVSGQWSDASHLQELYVQSHAPRARANSLKGFRVVLDCAHGAAAVIAPEVFRRLGAEVIAIHADTDGDSINLRAGSEHVRQHPEDLIRSVREHGASYGFAFDGDGDRLVVVDAEGHLFTGDDLLFAFATHFGAWGRLQGDTVVTTHTMNRGLDATLASFGIRVIRTGKGDKAIEEAMWSGGYTLGGEQVGNIIINDGRHTAADAVYTAMELAELVHTQRTSLAELTAAYRKWPQVLVAMQLTAEPPPDFEFRLDRHLQSSAEQLWAYLGAECRALAWPSSTEVGLVRVMVEGGTTATIESVLEKTEMLCRSLQGALACLGPCADMSVLSERGPHLV